MTDVAFVVHNDDDNREVIALMPGLAATVGRPDHCACYACIGQHSAASVNGMVANSGDASPDEYNDLLEELGRRGYDVQYIPIANVGNDEYLAARREQLEL